MKKEDEAILKLAKARFDKAFNAETNNRTRMLDDLKFANLDQWPDEVKEERKDKPMLTLDHTGQHVRQVVGDIRQNKPAIKIRPIDDSSDKDTAEVCEGLIRHIESNSNAQSAYITAAEGAVKAGYGVIRITTEYTDEAFDQDIKIKRVRNPFSVYLDPDATCSVRSDANWGFISSLLSEDEFKAKYPKAKADPAQTPEGTEKDKWYDEGNIRIAEYFVREKIKKTISMMSDGQIVCLDDLAEEERFQLAEQGLTVIKQREADTFKVLHYVVSGSEILEGPHDFPSKYIPLIPVYGEETDIEGEVEYKGIIRAAKDPQRMYNYWSTTGVELLALQPKAPWIGTADQFEGYENLWDNAHKANIPRLPYNPDPKAPGPPIRQMPPNPPAAIWQESAKAVDDIKAATGIYDSSLGAKGNEQSGRAILARERQSDVSTFVYIDNLSRSIEHVGRVLIDMIPQIYDTPRKIRILGEDDKEKVVKVNQQGGYDLTKGKYDVKVVTGPSYSTKRIESAESMMQFAQAVPGAAGVIADLIAKSMDWPDAEKIAARLEANMPPDLNSLDPEDPATQQKMEQAQQEQQKQQMVFQLELDAKGAEIEKDRATAAKSMADARKIMQEIDNTDEKLEQLVKNMIQQAMYGQSAI